MAFKDIFRDFFEFTEDEEVVEETDQYRDRDREDSYNKQQNNSNAGIKQNKTNQTSNQNEIKSVPSKRLNRNQANDERNYRMNNTSSKSSSQNVVTMNQSQGIPSQESSKMCLFEPRVFSDTQDIADELKNRRATLVNLQRIDKVSAKRIIDFLSGTVYAIGGDIQRVGTDIFLCTPDNVQVAGSITDHIENMEHQYE